MEAGCSYGVGDPRRDNFIKYYRLPTRQGVSIVHTFQRTSSVTFGQKKRVDWTVEDAYEWARRVYADGRLVFPGLDANNKVPYDVWILPCYYIKYGSFLTSLLHNYQKKNDSFADLPGFLDVINDINALTEVNSFTVHTIFINSVADLTGSSDNLREALRLLKHPESVYIAWKMACGNEMNVNDGLGDTICVVDLLEFLSKQKHPEKTDENDDAGTEENDGNEGEDESSIAKRIARKIAATFTRLMAFERTKRARGKDASKRRSNDTGLAKNLISQLLQQKTKLLSERKICVAQWHDSPIVLTEDTVDSMRQNTQQFYDIKRRTMLVQDGTTSLVEPLSMVNNGGKKPKRGRKASR